jgi:cytoskeleton protein RodZ
MARIGDVLQKARVQRGIDLTEVERATKVRVKFLRAMEEDRWEALPAPVYARGFLEIYARFLGLDDTALVDEYTRTVEGADRTEPIPPSVIRPGYFKPRRSVKPSGALLGGVLGAAVLALVVVAIVGALGDDGGSAEQQAQTESPSTSTSANEEAGAPSAAPSSEVSLELRPTGTVWVCVVDDEDRPLVNGETLAEGDPRGPFTGDAFDVTFGNGAVEMTVDGEAVEVPRLAEPLGYRVTVDGARRLDPADQPTCL